MRWFTLAVIGLVALPGVRIVDSAPSKAVRSPLISGEWMSSSHDALENAFAQISRGVHTNGPFEIVVMPPKPDFHVFFRFPIDPAKGLDHELEVIVDPQGASLAKVEDRGVIKSEVQRSLPQDWQRFISGKHAYDIALAALNGFDKYDKQGRLTVELRQDRYLVTFPLQRSPRTGARSADYAAQIQIDARKGTVLKRLAAS